MDTSTQLHRKPLKHVQTYIDFNSLFGLNTQWLEWWLHLPPEFLTINHLSAPSPTIIIREQNLKLREPKGTEMTGCDNRRQCLSSAAQTGNCQITPGTRIWDFKLRSISEQGLRHLIAERFSRSFTGTRQQSLLHCPETKTVLEKGPTARILGKHNTSNCFVLLATKSQKQAR